MTLPALPAASEDQTHRAVVQHLRARASPAVIWFHCPNSGARDPIYAARLKAMGTLAGVPDLIFVLPSTPPREPVVRFIELKAGQGRSSEGQREFQARSAAIGADYRICRSLDEALAVLQEWSVISHNKHP